MKVNGIGQALRTNEKYSMVLGEGVGKNFMNKTMASLSLWIFCLDLQEENNVSRHVVRKTRKPAMGRGTMLPLGDMKIFEWCFSEMKELYLIKWKGKEAGL